MEFVTRYWGVNRAPIHVTGSLSIPSLYWYTYKLVLNNRFNIIFELYVIYRDDVVLAFVVKVAYLLVEMVFVTTFTIRSIVEVDDASTTQRTVTQFVTVPSVSIRFRDQMMTVLTFLHEVIILVNKRDLSVCLCVRPHFRCPG